MSGPRRQSAGPTPRRRPPGRDFWGTDATDHHPGRVITPSAEPTALIESLGPLPFPGGQIAQQYFEAIYERAAALAIALATATGVAQTTDPSEA